MKEYTGGLVRGRFFHLPFGIGVNCAKRLIFPLIHRFIDPYDVTLADGTTPDIDPKFILSPQGPVPARLTRKQQRP